jgi:hypothetical protein
MNIAALTGPAILLLKRGQAAANRHGPAPG